MKHTGITLAGSLVAWLTATTPRSGCLMYTWKWIGQTDVSGFIRKFSTRQTCSMAAASVLKRGLCGPVCSAALEDSWWLMTGERREDRSSAFCPALFIFHMSPQQGQSHHSQAFNNLYSCRLYSRWKTGLPELDCERKRVGWGGAYLRHPTWKCTGGAQGGVLFDKQTRYPLRRWIYVWEEESEHSWYPVAMKQMVLIDTCGGGTYMRVPSGFYEA